MSHKDNPVHQDLFTIPELTSSADVSIIGLVGECADA